ncbi:ribosome maturation factor RimM [Alcaligenaceae bacterium]|nr:ribosome maturation factor RimM [Alcaligenaceae bacterium]
MLVSDTSSGGAPGDLVELGRVVSAYGVRGWIKIQPHAANGQVLLDAKTWWLKTPAPLGDAGVFSSARSVKVAASRMHSGTVIAQLAGMTDRDQAEALRGHTVCVPRSAFPATDDDEYYWVDLIGCRLFGEDDQEQPVLIGQVRNVIDNGAHAVLQVARATQADSGDLQFLQTDKGREIEVLVPFVSAHVHTVDIANSVLHSNWPIDL